MAKENSIVCTFLRTCRAFAFLFLEDIISGRLRSTQNANRRRLSIRVNLHATIYDVITILPRQWVHLAFAIIGKLQISLLDGNKGRAYIYRSNETLATRLDIVSSSILKDQSPIWSAIR